MSRRVTSVEPSAGLLAAWRLMRDRGVHHLAVVDGRRRLVGMVSDRDARRALLDRALRDGARAVRVKHVMSRGLLSVHPDLEIRQAAELMRRRDVGALPVVRERQLVGLLTVADVIAALTPFPAGLRGIPLRPARRRGRRGSGRASAMSRPGRRAPGESRRPRGRDRRTA
jgi:CBS domain-containing protein